jgi:thymidylate kinase
MEGKGKIGVICVILGPDGAGKGSVINKLISNQIEGFFKIEAFHWRPGLLPPLRQIIGSFSNHPEINPHTPKHKQRSSIFSLIRWGYYTFDFILGYFLKILPKKRKGSCILFDRYYYDYFVDPIRYGYNLPKRIFKIGLAFIPKPDLTIYLDNTPENLYVRKQELQITELQRQVNAFRELIPRLPNPHIVTTDKPLKEVVDEVSKLIINTHLDINTQKSKKVPSESLYLWKSNNYVALPSKKNCRWLIPTSPKVFKKSWDLYHPYSLKGRLFKGLMKSTSSWKIFKFTEIIKDSALKSKISKDLKEILGRVLKKEDITIAVSVGTPSPFQKTTALVMSSQGEPLAYLKIAKTPPAIQRVINEANILKKIEKINFENVKTPQCLYNGKLNDAYLLILSSPSFAGSQGRPQINKSYINIVKVLTQKTNSKMHFGSSSFYKSLEKGIESYSLSYRALLNEAWQKLKKEHKEKEITMGLSHGDFVPWNMVWKGKEVFLYDWESACYKAPVGIDLVHFLFQTGFLLKKLRHRKLLAYLFTLETYQKQEKKEKRQILEIESLILCYLLHMAVHQDFIFPLGAEAAERRSLIKLILEQ